MLAFEKAVSQAWHESAASELLSGRWCQADYTVTLQESLQHPSSGGSLLIGCKGEPNFQAVGYSYSTTYHLNAVRVPTELSADKRAGAPLRVTLRKQGDVIDVVDVE